MIVVLIVFFALLLAVEVGNLLHLHRYDAGVASPPRPYVSVLIPARNEASNLKRLLPSLLRQKYAPFEILVYDDDSDDDTWAMLQSFNDDRLRVLRGHGPPAGWVGKVHALYQSAAEARGDVFLFLDADAWLKDPGALERIVDRYCALGPDRVLTGFTDLRGSGLLLVSLVPHVILTTLPTFLVEHVRSPALGSVNGQCWMIDAATYRRLSPHEAVREEVLEDVLIGRYLQKRRIHPVMADVRREVAVYMYGSFGEAWRGFRKNAYLLMGGSVWTFVPLFATYAFALSAAPFWWPELLPAVYLLKIISDRTAGMPIWVTLLGPLAHVAGTLLQLDSAVSHWTGRATWKGRHV